LSFIAVDRQVEPALEFEDLSNDGEHEPVAYLWGGVVLFAAENRRTA
jgi:hypothetical protein